MLSGMITFVGITAISALKRFYYAALDAEKQLLSLGQGSMDDAIAFTAGLNNAWVGVNLPARPSLGLLSREEIKQKQSSLFPGRPANMRMAEFELLCLGVRVPHTPGADQRCPKWISQGFDLHHRLEKIGYQSYPAGESEKQRVETQSEAVFQALLGGTIYPSGTLEGRLQRQLGLIQAGMDLPDPMDFFEEITRHRLLHGKLPFEKVYEQGELDALAAAHSCWLAYNQPEQVQLLGVPEEGQVLIPLLHAPSSTAQAFPQLD